MTIDTFISHLAAYENDLVFNPWRDTDPSLEIAGAVSIRKKQLADYLARRVGRAKIFLIAEACGYQGGHFSGIAMTCERMILNRHPAVTSAMILGYEGKRTSRADSGAIPKAIQREKGFNEPTDSVVWKAALDADLSPDEFLLWNIFPFHPYKKGNCLTNRTPTDKELADGLAFTKELLALTGPLPIFAIGKKSENTLTEAGLPAAGLRHPANGGADLFRAGLAKGLAKV